MERQVEVPIEYKGNELKSPLRLDILIENQIIVELKSVEEMKPVFAKQLLTYLRLLDKRVVVELEGIASVAIAFVPAVLIKEIGN